MRMMTLEELATQQHNKGARERSREQPKSSPFDSGEVQQISKLKLQL